MIGGRRPTRRQGPPRAVRDAGERRAPHRPGGEHARLATIRSEVATVTGKIIAPPSRTFRLTSATGVGAAQHRELHRPAGARPDPPHEPEARVPRRLRADRGAPAREHHHPVRRRVSRLGHVPGPRHGELARRRPRPAALPLHHPVRVRERGRRVPRRRRRALPRHLVAACTGAGAAGRARPRSHRERRERRHHRRRRRRLAAPPGPHRARSSASGRCSRASPGSSASRHSPRSASPTSPTSTTSRTPRRTSCTSCSSAGSSPRRSSRCSCESNDRDDPVASDAIVTIALVVLAVGHRGRHAGRALDHRRLLRAGRRREGPGHGAQQSARHRPAALVHAPDVLLRRHRAGHRDAQRPPPVRGGRLRTGAEQRRRDRDAPRGGAHRGEHPHGAVGPRRSGAGPAARARAPPPGWSPWRSCSCPAVGRAGATYHWHWAPRHPAVRKLARLSGLDRGLRRRQPGRVLRRARAGVPHEGRRVDLPRRFAPTGRGTLHVVPVPAPVPTSSWRPVPGYSGHSWNET